MSKKNDLEAMLLAQLRALGLPEPNREYKFHKTRKWRFDFAYPERKIAIEVEGGTYSRKSRHTSPLGYRKDCEKYNTANALGWHVYRGDTAMVRDGSLCNFVAEVLND